MNDSKLNSVAQKLKVCGHPVRLRLLCAIAREAEPCVSELWVCVRQPQPVVSQHLAVLKEKEIVKSEVQGNRRIYSITDPFVKRLVDSLKAEAEVQEELVQAVQPTNQ
ncbi:MAG: ArsR/SmtB family transcription factor [Spirochaetales bacterium]